MCLLYIYIYIETYQWKVGGCYICLILKIYVIYVISLSYNRTNNQVCLKLYIHYYIYIIYVWCDAIRTTHKITQVPSGCEQNDQNGPHHCRYPRIYSIMWTPGPLSHTYAVLDWVLASKTFGLGVGYGHEWNSRLETLKLDSRIRLLIYSI